ncbi:MAG: rhomboid family intramembrane serine protease [Phycisphaerales bacterium]|nr:rhomboid family intramembrane serine protease [Phycisphaerales bacterium]
MFVPLGTDRPMRRRPRACEVLLALTIGAYVAVMLVGVMNPESAREVINWLTLRRSEVASEPWTLITYQFAHDSPFVGSGSGSGLYRLLHLAFNMVGLWVFGRPLEDRIGHLGLVLLYLGGGAVAGIGHLLESPAPVLGASGSVCALVGAFAVLLPRVQIRILLIFFIIGIWLIPATWVIAFWMVLDLVGFAGAGDASTAYAAHLGGYAAGIAAGFALLPLGRLRGDDVDALWMLKQWARRRRARADLQPRSKEPPGKTPSHLPTPPAAATKTPIDNAQTADEPDTRTWLRDVEAAMRSGRTAGAMQRWRRGAAEDPEACLGAPVQLDLANHLQADGQWEAAADAYQRLLKHHSDHPEAPMVRLLLSVLLIRRLDRGPEALELLEQATDQLHEQPHLDLASQLRSEIDE